MDNEIQLRALQFQLEYKQLVAKYGIDFIAEITHEKFGDIYQLRPTMNLRAVANWQPPSEKAQNGKVHETETKGTGI